MPFFQKGVPVEIKSGQSRIVVLIPSMGIVLKFSRVEFKKACHTLRVAFAGKTQRARKGARRVLRERDMRQLWSMRRFLFKGLVDNWSERRFYRETKYPVLAPTWLGLGPVNVQQLAQPLPIDVDALWKRLYPILEQDIFRDAHHFYNSENFGLVDGRFVVLDYASPIVQELMEKHGDRLFNEIRFDPI